MSNVRIDTVQKNLSRKGYHIDETWLRRENKDRVSIPLRENIPIVCNECGYTREIKAKTSCDISASNPCPMCIQQRKLDEKFGAGHIKILEYNRVNKNSKLYCTHLELEFEQKIGSMTKGHSPCICSSRYHTWKEIKIQAAARGYEVLDSYLDEDTIQTKEKFTLRCKKHGTFHTTISGFYYGARGCPQCGNEASKEKQKFTREEAQERINEVHGFNRYIVGDDYAGANTQCSILCTKCGQTRFVTPFNVYGSATRCSCETESQGESFLNGFLDYMSLRYEKQFKFSDCRHKKPLPFDFKVWNYDNTWFLLEFDGIQHFKKVPRWGGKKTLKEAQQRDQIKNKYCEKNKIFLIRVQNKKRNFEPSDKERVVAALERAGAFMSFFSRINRKHPWVIPVEI